MAIGRPACQQAILAEASSKPSQNGISLASAWLVCNVNSLAIMANGMAGSQTSMQTFINKVFRS